MGWTPLFCAVSSGRYENANELIEAHADVNKVDIYHKSLLHLVKGILLLPHPSSSRQIQHLQTPVWEDAGRRYARMLLPSFSILQDDYGVTPLMRACTYGDLESVKLLVDHGADVNSIDGQSTFYSPPSSIDNTPLHYACMDRQKPIFDYLLSKGILPPSPPPRRCQPWGP